MGGNREETSHDIFISYSKKDSEFAHRLAKDLAKAGLRVWDVQSLELGDSIAQAIEKGLKASRFIVMVMSPDYSSQPGQPRNGTLALSLR